MHQLHRGRLGRAQAAQGVDRHREESEVGGDQRYRKPIAAKPDDNHRRNRQQWDRLGSDDVGQQSPFQQARMGKEYPQHKAQHSPKQKAHQRFLQCEEGGLKQNCEQKGVAAPARRFEDRAHNFADVRHSPVIGADGQPHFTQADRRAERARGLLRCGFHGDRPDQVGSAGCAQQLIAFPEEGEGEADGDEVENGFEGSCHLSCLRMEGTPTAWTNPLCSSMEQI